MYYVSNSVGCTSILTCYTCSICCRVTCVFSRLLTIGLFVHQIQYIKYLLSSLLLMSLIVMHIYSPPVGMMDKLSIAIAFGSASSHSFKILTITFYLDGTCSAVDLQGASFTGHCYYDHICTDLLG
jgi:hypothetical protein